MLTEALELVSGAVSGWWLVSFVAGVGILLNSFASSALLSVVAYSACSVIMTLLNKALMLSMPTPFCVSSFQTVVSILLLRLYIGPKQQGGSRPHVPWRPWLLVWMPVAACFAGMLVTSFLSLRFLAVPIVLVFKNISIFATNLGEWLIWGRRPTSRMVYSLSLIVLGSALTANSDQASSSLGYLFVCLNVVLTAAFVLSLRAAIDKTHTTKFLATLYINVLALPMTLAMAFLVGEPSVLSHAKVDSMLLFAIMLCASGLFAASIGVASSWCLKETSPTSYSVVGSINKIWVALSSVHLFNTRMSWETVLYCSITLSGGFLYAYSTAGSKTQPHQVDEDVVSQDFSHELDEEPSEDQEAPHSV